MTTPTPRWTAEEIERIAREITHGWMAHLGYTPEQITEYEMNNQHERAGCEFTSEGWFCLDEDEKSLHPGYDELCEVAELVMFVLEHPALAGVPTAVGGETILVRDCPGADCRRHPFGEHAHSRTVTSYPDGSQHFGPWREVTDDPA